MAKIEMIYFFAQAHFGKGGGVEHRDSRASCGSRGGDGAAEDHAEEEGEAAGGDVEEGEGNGGAASKGGKSCRASSSLSPIPKEPPSYQSHFSLPQTISRWHRAKEALLPPAGEAEAAEASGALCLETKAAGVFARGGEGGDSLLGLKKPSGK